MEQAADIRRAGNGTGENQATIHDGLRPERSAPVRVPASTHKRGSLLPALLTKDGKPCMNRFRSHISAAALRWLPQALLKIDTRGRKYMVEEVEFPGIIGNNIVVETTKDDVICWAKRHLRDEWIRCVRYRLPEPTNLFTVVLCERKEAPGAYVIITAWIGPSCSARPAEIKKHLDEAGNKVSRKDQDRLYAKARRFWDNHAFVLDAVTFGQGMPLIYDQRPTIPTGEIIKRRDEILRRAYKEIAELGRPSET